MRHVIRGLAIAAIATLWATCASAADQETAQRIADSLRASGQLVDYSVGVKYEDGNAWLIGRVASEEQRQRAIQMAEKMPSVSRVIDNLEVKPTRAADTGAALRFNASSSEQAAVQPQAGQEASEVNLVGYQYQEAARKANAKARRAAAAQQAAPVSAKAYNNPGDPLAQSLVAKFAPNASRRFAGEPSYPVSKAPAARSPLKQTSFDTEGEGAQPVQAAPAPLQGQMIYQGGEACPPGQGPKTRQIGNHHPRGMAAYGPPSMGPAMGGCVGGACAGPAYEGPQMPNHAWPSYAAYPNYAGVTYPRQYSPTAWPYIGPFYPYPQVPLGWRKVALEWDDGWWFLDFYDTHCHH
jgi:BON domain-containing protein